MKEVILTTTKKISKETAAALADEIKQKFDAEKVVRRTDDSIVGGFTVQADGVFYDMSIASQLSRIRASLDSEEAD